MQPWMPAAPVRLRCTIGWRADGWHREVIDITLQDGAAMVTAPIDRWGMCRVLRISSSTPHAIGLTNLINHNHTFANNQGKKINKKSNFLAKSNWAYVIGIQTLHG